MKIGKKFLLALALVAGIVAISACAASADGNEVQGQATGLPNSVSLPLSFPTSTEGSAAEFATILQSVGSSQAVGISVTGSGSVTVSPDTALLTLGVQARRDSVALAREDAAAAMERIVQVLSDNGVADEDIKTVSLSIQPVYSFLDRKQVLEGFEVNNTVRVKIRDLDRVGDVIDGVADAGGDLTRIQSIGFILDDPTPFMAQVREEAVLDAVTKAQQLATLTGVTLDKPISISEGSGGGPIFDLNVRALSAEAVAPSTPISPGQMEISLNVSIVFGIQ
ncbi:MAG: SIMPL domain-containing protein [Dehalococcoidia bacterium]